MTDKQCPVCGKPHPDAGPCDGPIVHVRAKTARGEAFQQVARDLADIKQDGDET